MNEYTPSETTLVDAYAFLEAQHGSGNLAEAQSAAKRAIAKIKADAWEEGAVKGDSVGLDAIDLNPMHANPYR